LFSGLYDIEPLRYSYLQPQIQLDDRTIRRNSPAFSVRPCKTPIWITWGGAETAEFARQSEIYHHAWSAAGNTAELRAVPDANHFTVIAGFEIADSPVCSWLSNHLQIA
jgi:arylformamidase